ncbi:hypothetical protein ABZ707_31425 [Streptomyces sp. NPDC006923]|uniref:hypothetical protein n=1 Tax=Streptomyces sp. NPDC006923 TaxID=3155355 RepID=UPI0033C8F3B4
MSDDATGPSGSAAQAGNPPVAASRPCHWCGNDTQRTTLIRITPGSAGGRASRQYACDACIQANGFTPLLD